MGNHYSNIDSITDDFSRIHRPDVGDDIKENQTLTMKEFREWIHSKDYICHPFTNNK
jgi:hypothetical protein